MQIESFPQRPTTSVFAIGKYAHRTRAVIIAISTAIADFGAFDEVIATVRAVDLRQKLEIQIRKL